MSLLLLLQQPSLPPIVALGFEGVGLHVLIDGVDVTLTVSGQAGAIDYDDEVNTRSALRAQNLLIDDDSLAQAGVQLLPGETFVLQDSREPSTLFTADGFRLLASDGNILQAPDVTMIFGGTLDRVTSKSQSGRLLVDLDAVSFDQILDRHVVAEVYEDMFAGDIVRDLHTKYLLEENLNVDGVESGTLISYVVFNYITAAEALNKLGELSGMVWFIDANRVLNFQPRETNAAPFAIDDTETRINRFQKVRSRERYRNGQIIRAGHDLTDPLPATFKGDGARRTFNVGFPVGMEPTITLDTGGGPVAQTVGIRGLETGKQWYWNKDTTEISQDEGGTVLTTGHTLVVTYRGLFPVIIVLRDDDEVAARKALEGGSGQYTRVQDEPNLDSAQDAADYAFALLQRDGTVPTVVEFATREKGFRAGQLIAIDRTLEGIQGDFLITHVSGQFYTDDVFEVRVSATDSGYLGGWVEYFHKLAAKQRAESVLETETLITVRAMSAPVLCDVALELTASAPESRIGLLVVGWGEIGA